MGKAGRWLKSILAGKKDGGRGREKVLLQQQQQGDATPLPAASPREKKRWSFRRPAPAQQGKATAPSPLSLETPGSGLAGLSVSGRDLELEQSEHAVPVVVAAAAAAVTRLTAAEERDVLASYLVEEAAAARIQATFRGYLARKALCALRGLVKLQALIRGQLVRRQANATLRRMLALVSAQSRLRARMLDADHAAQRRSPQHPRRRSSYEMDRSGEEHVKIVEMDIGEPARRGRSSCSAAASESRERRLAEYYYGQCSPAPSALGAELSPLAYSGHFEDQFPFDPAATARSSPYVPPYAADGYAEAELPGAGFVPSYMANTESSRAKARSQSAPRQRTDAMERQPSRRRGGGVPGAPRKMMQRSSSHIGVPAAAACGYGYPWAGVRLDRSSASLVGSECGSTRSVLTAATVGYCRSLVGFEVHRAHY
ncbi:protein IQ-DOMAIN 19-like [Phragmites australis]|uniref:protein IQ-DOMAIN 19-like n=1 Tax=Phragmites australis TaxID=29695 RepID=UPI002D76798E|nr:protein IQ-DOMAIN 19-like [Phragmites australis]